MAGWDYKPTEKEIQRIREKYGIDKSNAQGTIFVMGLLDYFNFFEKYAKTKKNKKGHLDFTNPNKFGFHWFLMGEDFKWGVGSPKESYKTINLTNVMPGCSAALYNLVPQIAYSDMKFGIGFGTIGGLDKKMKIGDVVICEASLGEWVGAKHRLGSRKEVLANKNVVEALKKACDELKIKYTIGKVFSVSDVFLEPVLIKKLKLVKRGFVGVDYENYAAYILGKQYKKPIASLMVVSDIPVKGETCFSSERTHNGKDDLLKILFEKFKIVVLASKYLIEDLNKASNKN